MWKSCRCHQIIGGNVSVNVQTIHAYGFFNVCLEDTKAREASRKFSVIHMDFTSKIVRKMEKTWRTQHHGSTQFIWINTIVHSNIWMMISFNCHIVVMNMIQTLITFVTTAIFFVHATTFVPCFRLGSCKFIHWYQWSMHHYHACNVAFHILWNYVSGDICFL